MDEVTRVALDRRLEWVFDHFKAQLEKEVPDIARLSILLGLVELYYTDPTGGIQIPNEINLRDKEQVFDTFVTEVLERLRAPAHAGLDTRGKVKLVADLMWTKLAGVFSKEVLHCQHVLTFSIILAGKAGSYGKRQLDCAGVATCSLAVLQRLAAQHGFEDLADCRLQVSEDHCWISLTPEGSRLSCVEITTDTAAKRGLAPSEDAWKGWLYLGGHATVCSHKRSVAAIVATMNPAIGFRANSKNDSEEVMEVQYALLEFLRSEHPETMYPAALCALADLKEIHEQDGLDREVCLKRNLTQAAALCTQQRRDSAQALFEKAIAMAHLPESDASSAAPVGEVVGAPVCYQWYPYGYILGFLCRRADFALTCIGSLSLGASHLRQAANYLGNKGGAAVLRKYRYKPSDGELHKDLEGVLEGYCKTLQELLKNVERPAVCPSGAEDRSSGSTALQQYITPLLEFWDGICCLFSMRKVPSAWIGVLLKALKPLSPEVTSQAMHNAAGLWAALKPAALTPLFEVAEVEDAGRATKRPKR